MAIPVVAGAQTACSFGLAPGVLNVLPVPVMVESRPQATVMDIATGVNIVPFALCTSLTNPITAGQTAAAAGVLTPGTCTPVVPAPWAPGAPTTLINGKPALTMGSMCTCVYGGVITITSPGAATVSMT
jgi:uncharacterized Zn-binding protein involved in type VI secretion